MNVSPHPVHRTNTRETDILPSSRSSKIVVGAGFAWLLVCIATLFYARHLNKSDPELAKYIASTSLLLAGIGCVITMITKCVVEYKEETSETQSLRLA